MNKSKKISIALLGQPNSGKSTLFNGLTGARQHVGNWPGKTVEKKEGSFSYNNNIYKIKDLPGTYSLSANSDEEIITRDFIASGNADIVCILVDASQLERSLYMLADFAGINTPALLILNMMDVAKDQGKSINTKKLEEKLSIPVIPFIAADRKNYEVFYNALIKAIEDKRLLETSSIEKHYLNISDNRYKNALEVMPKDGISHYSALWLAIKYIENDSVIIKMLKDNNIDLNNLNLDYENMKNGKLETGNCKFNWINELISESVSNKNIMKPRLNRFDKIATSRYFGKPIAILIIILTLLLAMIVASPIMAIAALIPKELGPVLSNLFLSLGLPKVVDSLVCELGLNILFLALSMSGFVLGISFAFNLIEEVGYMARISFVFDRLMSRLGLQGKSIMAFFVSAGCTIGGVAGTRVIDNWGQRILAIILVWAVPCGATWAITPMLATVFFGSNAIFIMLGIVALMFFYMGVTAKIFGNKLAPKDQRTGMIMEMPPYHKPRWKNIIQTTLNHSIDIFTRALRVITVVALSFWLLSYTSSGDVSESIIYKIGIFIEPVTKVFGLSWQTFMAFVASAISKEAILGVLSSLYASSGSLFASTIGTSGATENLGVILASQISKAEALAFIFATTFNIPCIMALASTYRETHSIKWTAIISIYYTTMALLLAFVVYHLGLMIF